MRGCCIYVLRLPIIIVYTIKKLQYYFFFEILGFVFVSYCPGEHQRNGKVIDPCLLPEPGELSVVVVQHRA